MGPLELIRPKKSDRRSHPRVSCEIPISNDHVIRNLSLGGALVESRCHYYPNQQLPLAFTLPAGTAPVTVKGRVIHGETRDDSRKVGYGIAFEKMEADDLQRLSHFLLHQAPAARQDLKIVKGERYRQTRYGDDFLQGLKVRCFVMVGEKREEGDLKNFSRYGAAVSFSSPLEWPAGGVVKDLQILLEEREVFRGAAWVRHYRKLDPLYEYGFHFCKASIDLERVFAIKEFSGVDRGLSGFQEKLGFAQQVRPEFKIAMSDFHYLLENLKQSLEREEERLHRVDSPVRKKMLEDECLELVDVKFRRRFEDLASVMEGIVRILPEEEKQRYIQYCRDVLSRHLQDAPFIRRAFHKPLGYPGDYETMGMIYDERHAGGTLWEKAVNSLFWGLATNQAVRNRARYLAEKIRDVVMENPGTSKNIMSLACGPCKEIQLVLSDPSDPLSRSPEVSFYLIDQDPRALDFIHNLLGEMNLKREREVRLNTYRVNVRDFIKDPEARGKFPPQDLIYAAGLFDYLTDEIAELLVGILYFMLRPGGRLVIGNFSPFNPFRLIQEFGLDWFLNYRDEKDLKKLVPKFLKCGNITVEDEETHINLFLNLTRAFNGRRDS